MEVGKATTDTLDKVSGEFESEMLAELQDGKGQALSSLETTRKLAKTSVSKILETGVKQADSLKRQIIGAAELEARNSQLKALEKAVVEVFESAVKELHRVPAQRYQDAMARFVREGLDVIGADAKVYCRSEDRQVVSAVIRTVASGQSKVVLDDKSISTIGGVVMSSPDGSVRFDNTFEARLERTRQALRMDVSSVLTGT